MILIHPVHEHGISFRLFVLSSVSVLSVIQDSEYKFFTSLLLLGILFYFILFFGAIVNGIVFLISLSDSLLLVSILILYPVTTEFIY